MLEIIKIFIKIKQDGLSTHSLKLQEWNKIQSTKKYDNKTRLDVEGLKIESNKI